MKKLYVPLSFITLALSPLRAQTHEYLDVNHIKARVDARPISFYYYPYNSSGYLLKQQDISTISNVGDWFSATVQSNGTIYSSDAYSQKDFAPGPMRLDRTANDSTFSAAWNRVFSVTKQEIELFRQQFALGNVQNGTFPVPASITNWPGNGPAGYSPQLAPYIDVNGDQQYNPLDGDYPKIKGDQAVWRVLNDISSASRKFGDAQPMGIELQQMFYAVMDSNATGNDSLINYSTFIEYRIINRSLNSYTNFDVGLVNDYHPDDMPLLSRYTGTCVYNNAIYSFAQPIGSPTLSKKISQSMMLMSGGNFTHTKYLSGGGITTYPSSYAQLHNLMNGKWLDGSDMIYINRGLDEIPACSTAPPARYFMPSDSDPAHIGTGGTDPGFNWQFNKTGCPALSQISPAATIPYAVIGDTVLNPGDVFSFDIAYITQFNDMPGDSAAIDALLSNICQNMDPVKDYFDNVIVPAYETFSAEPVAELPQITVYPNPAGDVLFLSTGLQKPAEVQIISISGQTVKNIAQYTDNTAIDVSALAPGFYLLKAAYAGQAHTVKFIKAPKQ